MGSLVVKDVESGEVTLSRALSRLDGMSLITSSIIGSGIFAAPGVLLSNVGGDATLAMIVWVFGSVLAACMGFVFAELATLHPAAGGEYVFFFVVVVFRGPCISRPPTHTHMRQTFGPVSAGGR